MESSFLFYLKYLTCVIDDQDRLLMFASDWSIKFLSSCSQWHSDGTYKYRLLLFA